MGKSALALAMIALAMGFAGGVTATMHTGSSDEQIISDFHNLYHGKWFHRTVFTRWLGVEAMKCPLDMWIYQEIFHERKPDVLIETGTRHGGSALYFANVFDQLQSGRIYTVEIEDYRNKQPKHPRISYLMGSSTDPVIVGKIRDSIRPGERVMVTLDSNHTKDHVLNELNFYAPLVTVGDYLVVEDTHLGGHPIRMEISDTPSGSHSAEDPGPWGAVEKFLKEHPEFEADRSRERFGLTFNPRGWLKRVR